MALALFIKLWYFLCASSQSTELGNGFLWLSILARVFYKSLFCYICCLLRLLQKHTWSLEEKAENKECQCSASRNLGSSSLSRGHIDNKLTTWFRLWSLVAKMISLKKVNIWKGEFSPLCPAYRSILVYIISNPATLRYQWISSQKECYILLISIEQNRKVELTARALRKGCCADGWWWWGGIISEGGPRYYTEIITRNVYIRKMGRLRVISRQTDSWWFSLSLANKQSGWRVSNRTRSNA